MCIHLQSGHILGLMGGLIRKSFNLSIIGILMVLLEVEISISRSANISASTKN